MADSNGNPPTDYQAAHIRQAAFFPSRDDYLQDAKSAAAGPSRPTKSLYLTPEQEATVCKYISKFDHGTFFPRIDTVVYGQDGVGIDKLICRLNQDRWFDSYDPTKSDDFSMSPYIDGQLVRFEGIDQRPNLQWSPETWPKGTFSPYSYARHLEVCMLVYDVTSKESFEAARTYYDNFCLERSLERPKASSTAYCPHNCSPRPPFRGVVIVIANKIDTNKTQWEISIEQGEEFCVSIGAIFMPASALTGEGCGRKALLAIAYRILYKRIENGALQEGRTTSKTESVADIQAGHGTSRLLRWWSKAVRRPVKLNLELKSEKALEYDVSKPTTSAERQAANNLYIY